MVKLDSFKTQRNELLKEIRELPADLAIQKLQVLREKFDWAIDGYRNSLDILSDTTYQDRKHFLLELIQNADDATYEDVTPEMTFSIQNTGITIHYNETGFSIEDVIAITDTGGSTKIHAKRLSHGFIGEKGIGFKSVFALAKQVEIFSPPWNFKLEKKKCIVPVPIHNPFKHERGGTTLRIRFVDSASIDLVAQELFRIVEGDIESFLFLHQLSSLVIEDHRTKPIITRSITVLPENRTGQFLEIVSSQNEQSRQYSLYSKDIVFPGDLVRQRWDKLGFRGSSLRRKVTVAFPYPEASQLLPAGRLYCYLPTLVSLPAPLFLQVDGVTKADREKLHDPEQNSWNLHLLSHLPEILVDALLSLKRNPVFSDCLPDYIPSDGGDQQLAPQFTQVIERLKTERWVLTSLKGKDQWVSPENAIIPTRLLASLIIDEPVYRSRVEKYLNKRFVHPDWLKNKEWKKKLQVYEIEEVDEETFIKLLEEAPIPQQWLNNPENLISLYSAIQNLSIIKNKDKFSYATQYRTTRFKLLHAPIFPLPDKGFCPLMKQGSTNEIYWIQSRSKRKSGLEESLDFTIVSTEYTYLPKWKKENNIAEPEEFKLKKRRNKATRDFLAALDVPELDDETILRDVQIPYLINEPCSTNEEKTRYSVLNAIFRKFQGKRTKGETKNDDFLEAIPLLSKAEFHTKSGGAEKLGNMLLPDELKLSPDDHIYDNLQIEELYLPRKYVPYPKSEKGGKNRKKNAEKLRKWREDWRNFLELCGICNGPKFLINKDIYENADVFDGLDFSRYHAWSENINDAYTSGRQVVVYTSDLDPFTKYIIKNRTKGIGKLAQPLYNAWKRRTFRFDQELSDYGQNYLWNGNFFVKYTRHKLRYSAPRDIVWFGINRDAVPLQDINGHYVRSGNGIRVQASDTKKLQKASGYFHLVQESKDTGIEYAYHPDYLDSFEINSPDISHVNELWEKQGREKYDEILEVALEFASIGVNISTLLIFDKTTSTLKAATDFCMGFEGPDATPLIQKQYGEVGEEIGRILGLRDGNGPDIYANTFEEILHSRRVSKDNTELLHRILMQYPSWDMSAQQAMREYFEETMVATQRKTAVVVFNDKETYQNIYDSKIWVIHLKVNEDDVYGLQESARSIGFSLPDEIGELIVSNGIVLSNQDMAHLNQIYGLYTEKLSPKARSKLLAKLRNTGIEHIEHASIHRTDSIFRSLSENSKIEVPLPHFDPQNNGLYVKTKMDVCEIFANLLEFADYGNVEDLLPRIRDAEKRVSGKNIIHSNPNTSANQKNNRSGTITESVRNDITASMKRERNGADIDEHSQGWKCGPDPMQESTLRNTIKTKVEENLADGPEDYIRKVRSQMKRSKTLGIRQKKKIDPNANDPATFFNAEYRQQCQVCGTQLKLKSGKMYSVTYHIHENQDGDVWWGDQPFNILCMCPNCHALAKNGGCDLGGVIAATQDYEKGMSFPIEMPDYNGDYYLADIEMNGESKTLVISPFHMMHFAAVLTEEQEQENSEKMD